MSVIVFPSFVVIFKVASCIRKGIISGISLPGFQVRFTTPVALKPNDKVWVDIRNGMLHTVERGGIAIWRKDWVN